MCLSLWWCHGRSSWRVTWSAAGTHNPTAQTSGNYYSSEILAAPRSIRTLWCFCTMLPNYNCGSGRQGLHRLDISRRRPCCSPLPTQLSRTLLAAAAAPGNNLGFRMAPWAELRAHMSHRGTCHAKSHLGLGSGTSRLAGPASSRLCPLHSRSRRREARRRRVCFHRRSKGTTACCRESPFHCTGYSRSRNSSMRDPLHTWDQSCPRRQGSTDRLQSYTGSRCSQDNTRHLTHDTNDHTRRQPTQDDNRPKTTTTSGHRHKTTRQQDNKTTKHMNNDQSGPEQSRGKLLPSPERTDSKARTSHHHVATASLTGCRSSEVHQGGWASTERSTLGAANSAFAHYGKDRTRLPSDLCSTTRRCPVRGSLGPCLGLHQDDGT